MAGVDELLDHLFAASGAVLLTGPVSPDGDSLGACLALRRVLRAGGIDAWAAGDPAEAYRGLPDIGALLPDEEIPGQVFDSVVVLDGDRFRLTPPAAGAFAGASWRGLIDHHRSSTPDGYDAAWIEPGASSTCEMLFHGLRARGVVLDPPTAELLYAGLVFDTGCFRFSNADPRTHRVAADLLEHGFDHASLTARMLTERRETALRLAAEVYASARVAPPVAVGEIPFESRARLGWVPGDPEGLVDALVHVRDVDVAVLLVERGDGAVKLSLRSRGQVDVGALAARLAPTGGGHAKAAGVTLDGPLERVRDQVWAALRR